MKPTKKFSVVPDWFVIENYEPFNKLEESQIVEQLKFRYGLLINPTPLSEVRELNGGLVPVDFNDHENSTFESPECFMWRAIIRGEPLINFQKEYRTLQEIEQDSENEDFMSAIQEQTELSNQEFLKSNPDEAQIFKEMEKSIEIYKRKSTSLPGSNIVNTISVRSIKNIYESLVENNLLGEQHLMNGISSDTFFSDVNMALMENEIKLWGTSKHDVFLNIDLKSANDKEIIEQITNLLPLWRDKLNIPSPKVAKESPTLFSKVVPYKIIPYLDLRIWADLFGFQISYENICLSLFDEGSRDTDSFKQVVIPHEKKLAQYFDRLYEKEIIGQ